LRRLDHVSGSELLELLQMAAVELDRIGAEDVSD
jgi:hypothetical protein